MPRVDFKTPRLCVTTDLSTGATASLEPEQTHYLFNVLRLAPGDRVLVFNGRDGEFAATLRVAGKKKGELDVGLRTQEQPERPKLDYLFAPLKHARLDYVAQKAVEMGVGALRPVRTRRTQTARLNLERLRANAREAAEQCGVLWLAAVEEEAPLEAALEALPRERLLVFCDEDASPGGAVAQLERVAAPEGAALLVGPEGGFDDRERERILARPGVVRIGLGPRILRADTAAVAALALMQATLGDWRA